MLLEGFQQRGELNTRNAQESRHQQINEETKNNKENPQKYKNQKENGYFANFIKNFKFIGSQFYDLQDLFGLHLFSTIQGDQVFSLSKIRKSFVQSKLFDRLGITQELLDLWLTRIEHIYIQNEILIFTKCTSKNTKNTFQLSPYWKQHFLKIWKKELEIVLKQSNQKDYHLSKLRKSKAIGMTSYLTFHQLRNGSNTRDLISTGTGFNKQRICVVLSIFKGLGFVKEMKENKGELFFQYNTIYILPYLKHFNLKVVELRKKRRDLILKGKQLTEKVLSRGGKTNSNYKNSDSKTKNEIEIFRKFFEKLFTKKEKYICEIAIQNRDMSNNNQQFEQNLNIDYNDNDQGHNQENNQGNKHEQESENKEEEKIIINSTSTNFYKKIINNNNKKDQKTNKRKRKKKILQKSQTYKHEQSYLPFIEEEEKRKKKTKKIKTKYSPSYIKKEKKKKKIKNLKPSSKTCSHSHVHAYPHSSSNSSLMDKNSKLNKIRIKKKDDHSKNKIQFKKFNTSKKKMKTKTKTKMKNITKNLNGKGSANIINNKKRTKKINIVNSPINNKIIIKKKKTRCNNNTNKTNKKTEKNKNDLKTKQFPKDDSHELKIFLDDKQQLQTNNNSFNTPQILLSIQQNQKQPTFTISFPKIENSNDWPNPFHNSINENQYRVNGPKEKINNLKEIKTTIKTEKKRKTKNEKIKEKWKEKEKEKKKEIKNEFSYMLKKQPSSENNEIQTHLESNTTTALKTPPPSNIWNLYHGLNNITFPRQFGSLMKPNRDFLKNRNRNENQRYNNNFNLNGKGNSDKKENGEDENEKNVNEKGKDKEKQQYHDSKKSYNNFMDFVDQQTLDLNQQKNTNFQIQQIESNNFENTFLPNLYDKWYED
ncbi:serine/threonine-protein kinase plk [Anaeramoeba flamelloides]|uniref:Serine/threonine-protein kinase plk n=1 Tax=Anaeramoeba flamelloides TaxID=1746091 RepID=A0AAV7ZIH8_9EUKA|nr:serine/threonine-protein kinase plk [Anaeramoeba flamelloides]